MARKYQVTGLCSLYILSIPRVGRTEFTAGAMLDEDMFPSRSALADALAKGHVKHVGGDDPVRKVEELVSADTRLGDRNMQEVPGMIRREEQVQTPKLGGVFANDAPANLGEQALARLRQKMHLANESGRPFVLTAKELQTIPVMDAVTLAREIDPQAPNFQTAQEAAEFLGQHLPKGD